jgi:hypothetical protein
VNAQVPAHAQAAMAAASSDLSRSSPASLGSMMQHTMQLPQSPSFHEGRPSCDSTKFFSSTLQRLHEQQVSRETK